MSELIDRNKAYLAIEDLKQIHFDRKVVLSKAQKAIMSLPTIQPEIVRCKDCRYYNSEEKECLDLLGHGRRWEEDDFCSYAERREVNHE